MKNIAGRMGNCMCSFDCHYQTWGKETEGGDFPGISTQVPKMKTDVHGRKIALVAKLGAPCKQKPDLILH